MKRLAVWGHLGRLLLAGGLSAPQDAALRGDQQEAVSAVQRLRWGLHQTDLDAPPTCRRPTPTLKRADGSEPGLWIVPDLWRGSASGRGRGGRTPLCLKKTRRLLMGRDVNPVRRSSYTLRRRTRWWGGWMTEKEGSRTAGPTSLFLAPVLSSCVHAVPHVVLHDVLSGCQSPQGVSGALSPTGRANRSPVFCHSWAESANERTRSKNRRKSPENQVKKTAGKRSSLIHYLLKLYQKLNLD